MFKKCIMFCRFQSGELSGTSFLHKLDISLSSVRFSHNLKSSNAFQGRTSLNLLLVKPYRNYPGERAPAIPDLHNIANVYSVFLGLLHAHIHHFLPTPPIKVLITIQIGVPQNTSVMTKHPPPLRCILTKHPVPILLCSMIDLNHSDSHCTTWLGQHPLHISSIHLPSPYLSRAKVKELWRFVEPGVVPMRLAKIQYHVFLKSVYRQQITWFPSAVQVLLYPSVLYSTQLPLLSFHEFLPTFKSDLLFSSWRARTSTNQAPTFRCNHCPSQFSQILLVCSAIGTVYK